MWNITATILWKGGHKDKFSQGPWTHEQAAEYIKGMMRDNHTGRKNNEIARFEFVLTSAD